MDAETGFARTPPILIDHGPQMEDYREFDDWLFARRIFASEKMGITIEPRMKEAAEQAKIRRD